GSIVAEDPGVGLNNVTVVAPTGLGASYTLTLPGDDGLVGQILTTDGVGTLSWMSNPPPGGNAGGSLDGTYPNPGIADGAIVNADVNAAANIAATKLGTGAVDNTEFNYLDGVTSSIQTQFSNKQPLDADLTQIAGLTPTDNYFLVGNGANWTAEDAATARGSMGLGTIATQNANAVAITGGTIDGTTVGATTASTVRGSTVKALTNFIAEDPGAGTFTTTIQSATLAASYVLTLPVDDGTSGQLLQTDGAGVLSWISGAAPTGNAGGSLDGTYPNPGIADGAIVNADVNAAANIAATKLGTGAVDNTEFNYLDGVTSSIQTQFSNKQPLDSDLTQIAGLTATLDNFMVGDGANWILKTPANARTSLGLGTMALQNDNAVAITGGTATLTTATLKTSLVVEDPGAGTFTTTIQSATLGASYVLTLPVDDGTVGQLLQTNGAGILSWISGAAPTGNAGGSLDGTYPNPGIADGAIVNADVNAAANIAATKLGTGVVDNTEFNYLDGVTSSIQTQFSNKQPLDADLTQIAGLTPTDNYFMVGNGANWMAEDATTARSSMGLGTIATQNANTVAISGGSINGTTVGATTPAAVTGTTLTATASIIAEDPGVGLNSVTVVAPTGLGTSYTLTLPTDDGLVGQILTTNGVGTLSWMSNPPPGGNAGGSLDGTYPNPGIADGAIVNADVNAAANIAATKLGTGAVDNTEFNYLDGVTSSIQTQFTNKQPLDADLTQIAGLTPTLDNFMVGDGANWILKTPANARTSLGLGTMATQNANLVAITGGAIDGTTVGATTASTVRGSTVKALTSFIAEDPGAGTFATTIQSATLAASYVLTLPVDDGTSGQLLQTDGAGVLSWISGAAPTGNAGGSLDGTYPNPGIADGAIVNADVNAAANIAATKLGTGAVDNTEFNYLDGVTSAIQTQFTNKQPLDADLTTISGLTATTDYFMVGNAGSWTSVAPATARTSLGLGTIATQNANGVAISGGSINGTTVGATTPAAVTGTSLTATSSIIAEDPGIGLNNVTIQSPTGLGASYLLTLPVDDGTAGQLLKTDGAGVLSWISGAAPTGNAGGSLDGTYPNPGIADGAIVNADVNAAANIAATKLGTGAVDNTEFNYLDGVTSAIQTQFTNKQPLDADLTQIASLTATLDNFMVGDGANWVLKTPANARTSLGLGTMATQNANAVAISGGTATLTTATLKTSLVVEDPGAGTFTATMQAPTLAASYTLTLPVDDGTLGQVLSTDGNGVLSWLSAPPPTGPASGSLDGNYPNPGIADGTIVNADVNAAANIAATKLGTGAVDNTEFNYLDGVTSSIQTQFTNKQPLDADLTTISGLTATTDYFLVGNAGSWTSVAPATARTSLGLGTMATQNANALAVTGGAIDGTTVGATTASTVRGSTVKALTSFIAEDPGAGTFTTTIQSATLGASYTLTLPVDDGTVGQLLKTDGAGVLSWVSGAAPTGTAGGSLDGTYPNPGIADGTIANADVNAAANIDATKLGTGAITNTEFNYLDGVTSAIQTQFTGKEPSITAGTTSQFWRGDKSWQAFGTMISQNANAVAITGGTINGTTIGATTPSTVSATTIASGTHTVTNGTMDIKNSDNTPRELRLFEGSASGNNYVGLKAYGGFPADFSLTLPSGVPGAVNSALVSDTSGNLSWLSSLPPSGAAGGDLTGTYPNPTIGTGKVTSAHIFDGEIVNADINAAAGIVDTKLATISTAGKVSNSATTATSANTGSAIVARDASGNFSAGTITAGLTGAASLNVLKAGDTMSGDLTVQGRIYTGYKGIVGGGGGAADLSTVWLMGASWPGNPGSGGNYSGFYGMGFCFTGNANCPSTNGVTGYQFDIVSNGVSNIQLGLSGNAYFAGTVYTGGISTGSLTTSGDVTGARFVDYNSGTYYLDPASTSNLNGLTTASAITANSSINANAHIYMGTGSWIYSGRQGIVGTYNSTEIQNIWSMGSAYVPSVSGGGSWASQYGMSYCHTNNANCKAGYGHQIDIVNAGTVGIALGLAGSAWFSGNIDVDGVVNGDGGFSSGGNTVIDAGGGWHRSYGNTGWYNGTYGGGWYMTDTSWLRAYNDKGIATGGSVSVGGNLYIGYERVSATFAPASASNWLNIAAHPIYYGGGTVSCSAGKQVLGCGVNSPWADWGHANSYPSSNTTCYCEAGYYSSGVTHTCYAICARIY
ncbi:MAG TPA: hypothetical protein DCY86_11710, partial [Bdellovibrionales bacterium]|nr:hypothetical protein [Bdellovibrionales bacterium]